MNVEINGDNVNVTAPSLKVSFSLSTVKSMTKTQFKESIGKRLFGYADDVYKALPIKHYGRKKKALKSKENDAE